MRILMVFTFELPGVGGVPTYLKLLEKEYKVRGHHVDFLSPDPTWTKFQLLHAGKSIDKQTLEDSVTEKVHNLYLSKFPDIPRDILELEIRRHCLMRAAELFGLEHYDLIHAQDAFSSIAMAQVLSKHRKIPLVTTLHGCIGAEVLRYHTKGSPADEYVWAYGYAVDHYAAIGSDATIVPAQWIKTELHRSFGVPKNRITVVEHGLDLDSFMNKLRNTPGTRLRSDSPVIFNHQRLDPFKGHKFMLNALASLRHRRHRFRAYIAGSGGMRSKLDKFTAKLNLQNRVTFLGTRSDVPALLAQSDIVVLPSIVEGVCYSAIEAQLAGKPVVAFRTTGLNEVVSDGRTGLLSPVGDFQSLAKNIKKLLQDASLRKRMGAMAKERALRKWSHKRMAAETLEVYRHAIAGKGKTVPDNVISRPLRKSNLNLKEKLKDIYRLYNTNVHIPPLDVSSGKSARFRVRLKPDRMKIVPSSGMYLGFNLGELPADTVIHSAVLRIPARNRRKPLAIHKVKQKWTVKSSNKRLPPTYSTAVKQISKPTGGGGTVFKWNCTSMVKRWNGFPHRNCGVFVSTQCVRRPSLIVTLVKK